MYYVARLINGQWVLGEGILSPRKALKEYKIAFRLHGSLNVMMVSGRTVIVSEPTASFAHAEGQEVGLEV